ncbi:MAG: hypothetical protein JF886_09660 [Candidatus Dormibacteraeota bacterium]|uniref:Cytochrome aa3 subunit 4 n=1 Tax=Candidatus Aeolococcus gillhamiae TaxID=3127015 RepID=A0A2W5ZWX3_9BACT|nr:hypothetical protein [Candidatus Dormibacteraeota bacterium]PZR77838.1 MAG: hypothetical protein DLM65_14695 [Candidatus Dormibacter sp. RRmetagenome_bin12]
MTDENLPTHEAADTGHGEHAGVHLPPPSVVPIMVALSLATVLIGFVDQVRGTVGPLVWGIGLVWLIASLLAWYRGARTEFHELPESVEGH